MVVLVTCMNKEDSIKNKGPRAVTTLSLILRRFKGSEVQSRWWSLAEIQTRPIFYYCPFYLQEWRRCIKNDGSRVVTTFLPYKFMGIFQDAQGQLTPMSLVGSCRFLNPSEMLWLSSLPVRIKKNQSKMKELEWSQDFPHYNSMGSICCHGNQSSDPILPKT